MTAKSIRPSDVARLIADAFAGRLFANQMLEAIARNESIAIDGERFVPTPAAVRRAVIFFN